MAGRQTSTSKTAALNKNNITFAHVPMTAPHACCVTGDKTFTNHSTGSVTRLGPWGYSYTPAGQVHSAQYHADTVFYIGFEGEPPDTRSLMLQQSAV